MAIDAESRSERGRVLVAIVVSNCLVALDTTIVASAVPSIVASVGGYAHFPWVFSMYLLTQAVTVPIYGKLADEFGRKPVMLFGIALFLAGSVACGLAWSMGSLIAFRALQGLGAGAVQPIAATIPGDLYSVAERPKAQAWIAGGWALAAVTGSATGGLIAEHFGWRLIFLANVPACIVTAAMLIRYFHEPAITGRPRIDYLGASLLAVCCALFMLVILKSDAAAQWYSPGSLLLLAGAAVGAVVLVLVERRAERPILPLWIWRHRLLVVSAGLSATGGGILIGVITYVPVYAHQVLHCGAFAAGAVLALFMFGWPLGASVSGRIYVRFGFRNCELTGSVIIVCGAAVFATLGRSSGLGTVGAACLVTGFGLGLITSPLIVAAQSSVTWQRRGAVTAVNTFSRAIGSSFAGAVFGAVLTASLGSTHSGGVQAISTATHRVFDGLLALSVLIAIGVLALPKDHRWRTAPAPPGEVSDICHPTNSSTLAGQAVDEPSSRRLLSD